MKQEKYHFFKIIFPSLLFRAASIRKNMDGIRAAEFRKYELERMQQHRGRTAVATTGKSGPK